MIIIKELRKKKGSLNHGTPCLYTVSDRQTKII